MPFFATVLEFTACAAEGLHTKELSTALANVYMNILYHNATLYVMCDYSVDKWLVDLSLSPPVLEVINDVWVCGETLQPPCGKKGSQSIPNMLCLCLAFSC